MIRLRKPPTLQYHDEFFVPATSLEEVNRKWDALCAQNSACFDGEIVHVLGVHRNGCGGATIQAARTSYKFHAVMDLGIKPLGVKGICKQNDVYLCGLRGQKVGVYAGAWEFAPSGMVEPHQAPEDIIMRELEEETGLTAQSAPVAVALFFDEIARTWEIVYQLETIGHATVDGAEYEKLDWFDIKRFPSPMSPPTHKMKSLL